MIKLQKITEADLFEKTVLLRADLDVPLKDGEISDDLRLQASLETISFLLKIASRVIVCGHLGRPNQESRIKNPELSLKPIAEWYANNFKFQISNFKFPNFDSWQVGEKLFLLENMRLNPGEEANDGAFANDLAKLAEVYVNDAFASSHRAHASIVGVPKLLPHFPGLRLGKEVEELSQIFVSPKRPLTVIIGGAKIETKLPLVSKMQEVADYILVGGQIAEHGEEIVIPTKHSKIEEITLARSAVLVADLSADKKDITKNSLRNFIQIIDRSKTIVWNGPMGLVEEEASAKNSQEIARAIIESHAHSIVGGGDTVGFITSLGLLNKFSFVSTGGGAMLEFLSGEKLPGLVALT